MTTTRERDARIAVEAAGRVIGVAIESEEEKEETNDEWRELSRSPHFPPPFFCFGLGGKRDRTAMQSSLQRNLKARLRVQAEKAAKVQEAKMQEARGVRLWRETEGTRGERGKAG